MPLTILAEPNVSVHIRNFAALAEVFGLEPQMCPATSNVIAETDAAFVVDLSSLARLCSDDRMASLRALSRAPGASILLLATDAEPPTRALLQQITEGAVDVANACAAATTAAFTSGHRDLTQELSGFSYPRRHGDALALTINDSSLTDVAMMLDGAPSFVRLRSSDATIFVWAAPSIFDPLKPLQAEREFEDCVEEYSLSRPKKNHYTNL